MPTAWIQQPRANVHLKSERLEVYVLSETTGKEDLVQEIPLRDVERLILGEGVEITSRAMAEVMRRGIPISLIGWNGHFLGGFLPATNDHGLKRLKQYERGRDGSFCLSMAGRIVTAKLYNQRRVVQRLWGNRAGASVDRRPDADGIRHDIEEALAWLDSLFGLIARSQSVEELRGYEGAATARYFQAWARFLPPEFPFERRSTRPPLNAVNACISFGATVLYAETAALIQAHGLDAAIGVLHATENGRWNLALDLMEVFRPVLVEALALDLVTHQILNGEHFEAKNGGVYLNEPGRKKFVLQYERRMGRQFMSESAGHRTCLRRQLEQQAVMFKSALEEPDRFQPFLMN